MTIGIKIYLIVVTIMLIVALGLGVYVWHVVQNLKSESAITVPQGTPEQIIVEEGGQKQGEQAQDVTQEKEMIGAATGSSGSITIQKKDLSTGQQKVLETVGIKGETITITPEMVQCAEDSLGKDRVDEIIAGSAPGPLESFRLLQCID